MAFSLFRRGFADSAWQAMLDGSSRVSVLCDRPPGALTVCIASWVRAVLGTRMAMWLRRLRGEVNPDRSRRVDNAMVGCEDRVTPGRRPPTRIGMSRPGTTRSRTFPADSSASDWEGRRSPLTRSLGME